MAKLNVGDWNTEATRTLDAIARSKTEGPIEFWTGARVEQVRKDAEALAGAQGKAVYQQHVHWAAGNLADGINTGRWFEKQLRKIS